MSRVRESVFPACDSSSILRGHLCLVARVGMEGVGRRGSDRSHLPQAVFYTESHGVFRKDRRKPRLPFLDLDSAGTVLSQFFYQETATDILRREGLSQARLAVRLLSVEYYPARLLWTGEAVHTAVPVAPVLTVILPLSFLAVTGD